MASGSLQKLSIPRFAYAVLKRRVQSRRPWTWGSENHIMWDSRCLFFQCCSIPLYWALRFVRTMLYNQQICPRDKQRTAAYKWRICFWTKTKWHELGERTKVLHAHEWYTAQARERSVIELTMQNQVYIEGRMRRGAWRDRSRLETQAGEITVPRLFLCTPLKW
jgi:hypothetical protein